ncbi:hypothetical protein FCR2A7T_07180 [Flavobacterium cauense R2A-7]|nr:hypothetical protein FCR2A7T_07180 [Flavobacterium cauense R2A-7]
MYKKFTPILFCLFILSCSTKKLSTTHSNYHSAKLCVGIKNMINYVENSNELKSFFRGKPGNTILEYECDTLVNEGIPRSPFDIGMTQIIEKEEKISHKEAEERLARKFLIGEPKKLYTGCVNKSNSTKPEVKVSYYYYPEYSLLITEVERILYEKGYSSGYMFLTKLNNDGDITIINSTFWEG